MPATYTSNYGNTPQANQLQTSMVNAQSGNYAALPPMQQLTGQAGQATQQLADMQTPQNRQSYMQNSDLPAMQGNYEDLAKQLYEYDKQMATSGQVDYSNIAPDANQFGSVAASPLELTNSILSKPNFSFVNPAIGLNTNLESQNNITDLLGILNNSIGKEFSSRKNTYASTVSSQRDVLKTIMDIMGLKSEHDLRMAEMAASKSGKGVDRYSDVVSLADKLKSDLSTGVTEWGDAWNTIKNFADRTGVQIRPEEIDQLLGGKYDPADPTGAKGLTKGWAAPGAAQNYASGLRYKQTQASGAEDADFQGIVRGLDKYLVNRSSSTMGDRLDIGGNALTDKGREVANERNTIGQLLARLVEKGRLSDQDRQFYLNMMPQWWENDTRAKAAINGLKSALSSKLGYDLNPADGGNNWE